MALLEIRNLSVEFPTARGVFRAVDGINITLEEGELLGVVGESGSGKSSPCWRSWASCPGPPK